MPELNPTPLVILSSEAGCKRGGRGSELLVMEQEGEGRGREGREGGILKQATGWQGVEVSEIKLRWVYT